MAKTVTKNLKDKYNNEVRAKLKEEFKYANDLQIPKLSKTKIAGQRAVVTKAKKSISAFKLREGMPVGSMVTLRGERMYDFLQKLICVVLPRIRDFRGVSKNSFDGRGNYTFGLKEQSLFPEIHYEEVDIVKGMNISIITTATTDDEARSLLAALGMPFKK